MNEELEKEQEQSGVSFREIFNALFKWKWLALAVVVICTLLTYILTSFVINPTRTNYSYSFYVMFPNSTSETYPDGTPFDYRDIISSSNLVATKESDEEFSNIDVERMEKKGDISIGRQMDTLWDLDNITDTNIQYEYKYTVTVKSSYFKNGDIAAKFITSLAQYPLDYAIQVTENLNYKVNLEAYKNPSNTRYSERLNYLLEERSFILNQLDSLINIYDSNYPVNGNSLSYWRSQADFAFSSALEDELKNDLDNYSYVYKENEDSILTEIALLERENLVSENIRSELKTQREELLKSFTDGAILTLELESYNTKITELTEQIEKKENEIEVLYQSIYYVWSMKAKIVEKYILVKHFY